MPDPLETRNETIHAMRQARKVADQRAAGESEPTPTPNRIVGLFAAAFGWLWIGAIGFGLFAAVLSPGSCSGGRTGDYRAR